MEFNEFLISFSLIMMLMSLISERAANFVKIHFQGRKIHIPFVYKDQHGAWKTYLDARLEILAYKQPTEAMEKEREYRVMVINILVGIFIATLGNANFFEILREIGTHNTGIMPMRGWYFQKWRPEVLVGALYMLVFLWAFSLILFNRLEESKAVVPQRYVRYPFLTWMAFTIAILLTAFYCQDYCKACLNIIVHCFGYMMTGLFLSLGSKFWHDLLDILFKFKNTEQVLADQKTYSDYDSTDRLVALAETSQYDVVEKLYALYGSEIKKISGVVSHGLHTIMDRRTKLYKKVIEVEFTNSQAQSALKELQQTGSIVLNYNTYYLRDFMEILATSKITAAVAGMDQAPSCYAFNMASPDNKGSFNVVIEDQKYYAVSNLHVLASATDLQRYNIDANHVFVSLTVGFMINNLSFTGTIDVAKMEFGNIGNDGKDLCYAEIDSTIYNAYQALVPQSTLLDFDQSRMKMFGATSKYLTFPMLHDFRTTDCNIDYEGFTKQLYLIKINTTGITNINFGDSGAFVYYKIKSAGKINVFKGVIIAKSDNYAYMFEY